jgi:phosphoribosylglycinamide formyltransferase-1
MPNQSLISVPEYPTDAPAGRLAVLASGTGTNFERILEAVSNCALNATVCGLVYNRPDAGCADVAARYGIAAHLVDHRQFQSRPEFDEAVVNSLDELTPDLVVMAGWMRIATAVLIDAFPDRIVNIHPSLLPAFKGMNAVPQALEAGVMVSGCSVHVVRLAVDDGPILGQAAVPVLGGDDEASLHERIQQAEHALYPRAIGAYLANLKAGNAT